MTKHEHPNVDTSRFYLGSLSFPELSTVLSLIGHTNLILETAYPFYFNHKPRRVETPNHSLKSPTLVNKETKSLSDRGPFD
jgi:hypothetical protein